MVLNRVWIGMFITAIIMGFSKLIFWQDTFILQQMLDSFFEAAKSAFELALYMTGVLPGIASRYSHARNFGGGGRG